MRSLWLPKPTPISTFSSSCIALGSVGPECVIERGLADLQPRRGFPHGQPLGNHATSARQLLGVNNWLSAALSASRRCGGQSGTGPFADQIPLKLSQRSEEMENQPATGRRGVNRLGNRAEPNATLLKRNHDFDQMR